MNELLSHLRGLINVAYKGLLSDEELLDGEDDGTFFFSAHVNCCFAVGSRDLIGDDSTPFKKVTTLSVLINKLESLSSAILMLLTKQTEFPVHFPIEKFLKLLALIFQVDGSSLVCT